MRTRTPGRVAWGMKFFTALHSPALGLLFGLGSALTCQAEDPTYYRGNTHTHSLWSDGNDFPEMIVDWYQQQGYDFIALSDHNILAEGDKWMAVEAVKSRQKVPGAGAMEKYRARFGETWVKTREKDGKTEVRLSTLEECVAFREAGRISDRSGPEEISSTWRTASAPKGLPGSHQCGQCEGGHQAGDPAHGGGDDAGGAAQCAGTGAGNRPAHVGASQSSQLSMGDHGGGDRPSGSRNGLWRSTTAILECITLAMHPARTGENPGHRQHHPPP
ncbi:MAG: hypothetical protein R3F31_14200 [Verrucomicrobiales bacterium]